jgi:hypothetical protein
MDDRFHYGSPHAARKLRVTGGDEHPAKGKRVMVGARSASFMAASSFSASCLWEV